jgi:hypothetical protein
MESTRVMAKPQASIRERTLVSVGHPDDETIACGAVQPRDMRDAARSCL